MHYINRSFFWNKEVKIIESVISKNGFSALELYRFFEYWSVEDERVELAVLAADGDGVVNDEDMFQEDGSEWSEFDGDGTGDNMDLDKDGDDVTDINDDLPYDPTESVDTDGDCIGDKRDSDDDNDGVSDSEDIAPLNANISKRTYTWLALPLVIVILYVITIIFFKLKPQPRKAQSKPTSEKVSDKIQKPVMNNKV